MGAINKLLFGIFSIALILSTHVSQARPNKEPHQDFIDEHNRARAEGPYGENLAEGYGEMTGGQAVKFWVTEKPNYDYASNTCVGDVCGHYTQVVWRNSTHVGCARAKCKNGWMFVICSYYPPGNYIGERPY
ncbi:unnamed protein product [Prunus armeniaca]